MIFLEVHFSFFDFFSKLLEHFQKNCSRARKAWSAPRKGHRLTAAATELLKSL
jgi:hypothetical protein